MADFIIRNALEQEPSRGQSPPSEYCPLCDRFQEALLIQGKVYCARCHSLLATCCEGI